MTFADARRKLDSMLIEMGKHIAGGLTVLDDHTITKPYGWVFFYTGAQYAKTHDLNDAIGGNGPIVILAETGEAVPLGTARHPTEEVASFEKERGLQP